MENQWHSRPPRSHSCSPSSMVNQQYSRPSSSQYCLSAPAIDNTNPFFNVRATMRETMERNKETVVILIPDDESDISSEATHSDKHAISSTDKGKGPAISEEISSNTLKRFKGKQLSINANIVPSTNKCSVYQEEEFTRELTLFPEELTPFPEPKNDSKHNNYSAVATTSGSKAPVSAEPLAKEVSTEQTLSIYPKDNCAALATTSGNKFTAQLSVDQSLTSEEAERHRISFNLSKMKYYSPDDEEEERLNGVSTKLKLYEDPWTTKKTLNGKEYHDILTKVSVMLSKAENNHISPSPGEEFVKAFKSNATRFAVWDVDTNSMHELLVFKDSPTSKDSYILMQSWKQDFVLRRNLREGDTIGLYWDEDHSRFNFSVLKRGESVESVI